MERAEGVADGVRHAGAAAVDGRAGQERRFLHPGPGVEVTPVGHGVGEVLAHEAERASSAGSGGRSSRRWPVTASRAWTKASSPVIAVTAGGMVAVASGSSTTRSGSSSSPHVHTFRPSASVRTHVRVTSAPVPEVVGMATIGRRPVIGWRART